MDCFRVFCLAAIIIVSAIPSFGRVYLIDDGVRDYRAGRSKRQAHPASTVARFPSDPFAPLMTHISGQIGDSFPPYQPVQTASPSEQNPVLVDYLRPPSPQEHQYIEQPQDLGGGTEDEKPPKQENFFDSVVQSSSPGQPAQSGLVNSETDSLEGPGEGSFVPTKQHAFDSPNSQSLVASPAQKAASETNSKWDLGFDADDLLNPPAQLLQSPAIRPYETLKYFQGESPFDAPQGSTKGSFESAEAFDAEVGASSAGGAQVNGFRASGTFRDDDDSEFRPIIRRPLDHHSGFPRHQGDDPTISVSDTSGSARLHSDFRISHPTHPRQTNHNHHYQVHFGSQKTDPAHFQGDTAQFHPPHDDSYHHSPSFDHSSTRRAAAPVYTFVKTDKHGHFKWGVRLGAGHSPI